MFPWPSPFPDTVPPAGSGWNSVLITTFRSYSMNNSTCGRPGKTHSSSCHSVILQRPYCVRGGWDKEHSASFAIGDTSIHQAAPDASQYPCSSPGLICSSHIRLFISSPSLSLHSARIITNDDGVTRPDTSLFCTLSSCVYLSLRSFVLAFRLVVCRR